MRVGPERSEGPYRIASERFTNILTCSTWFTREIQFFVFPSIFSNSFIIPVISSIKNSNHGQFLQKLNPHFSVSVLLGNFTCVLRTHFKEVLDVLFSYSLIKKNDMIPAYINMDISRDE